MKYFMIGGDKREYGPVEAELIREWVREGRANSETLLRMEGETDWKPLGTFADFATEAPPLAEVAVSHVPLEPSDVRIRPAHCFARAWHLVGEHFGVIAGSTLLVWMALTAISISCLVGPWIAMLFEGPLYGALFLLFLNLIRTGEATTGQLFALTRDNTASLMAAWLLVVFLSIVGLVCCCVLPGIYLYVAWILAVPIIADQSVGFWRGMELSRRIVTPQWFSFFVLFVISFLPVLVFQGYFFYRMFGDVLPHLQTVLANPSPGAAEREEFARQLDLVRIRYVWWPLVRQGLLLFTLPLGLGTLAFAYEDIFGRKK